MEATGNPENCMDPLEVAGIGRDHESSRGLKNVAGTGKDPIKAAGTPWKWHEPPKSSKDQLEAAETF